MGLFNLMFLPFRVLSVFGGFTFTDMEDFTPLLSLLIGLMGAAYIYLEPRKKVSSTLLILMLMLSLGPVLPNIGLWFMAREHQLIRGNWPQVMIDDPKNAYSHVSTPFDRFFHLVNYLEAISGAWMVVFIAVFLALQAHLSRSQRRLVMGFAAISILLVVLDPGYLYAWWVD